MKDSSAVLPITVVILTKDEEVTVEGAVRSAKEKFIEVIVLDSFSADQTCSIATAAGARVVQHPFSGYASQRNFALHEMEKKSEWVFFLDADERFTPELIDELESVFSEGAPRSAGLFYVRRKDFFDGQWIRRSSGYPTWFGRLCHAPSVKIVREVNEEYHCDSGTQRLGAHLLHYPFIKGLAHWIDRHNRYSTSEALLKSQGEPLQLFGLISADPGTRRKAAKQIYMRLPFRPLFGFLYLYFVRGGFLDGASGLRFALLRAFYEFMISLKTREIRKG